MLQVIAESPCHGAPHRYTRAGYGALAITAVLCLSGCASLGPAEQQSLRMAGDLYEQNRIAEAKNRLDQLIRDFGGAVEIGEAYYLRGLCRTRGGDAHGASEDFEKAIDTSRREDLKARSRASLAALAAQRGAWTRAADLYAQALDHLPDEPPTDEILYRAGVAMQRSGRWADTRRQFARILWKFRGRPIADEARRMASWRYDYFAIQLGAFSNAANGERAEQTFRAKGLDAVRLESRPRGGSALWVVMSGRYPTYRDAVGALQRARAIEPNASIIPRP